MTKVKFMNYIIYAIAIILTLFILACARKPTVNYWDKINSAKFLIDVRTNEEFNSGHLENSLNIPYEQITQKISELTQNKGDLIVLYCRSGRRSGIAKSNLDKLGYLNVVNAGGYDELIRSKPN
jgi:phage shock protein E